MTLDPQHEPEGDEDYGMEAAVAAVTKGLNGLTDWHGYNDAEACGPGRGPECRGYWFQQHLANIFSTSVGDAAATNVRPYLHHVDGHDICRVQVDACGFPIDAQVIYQKPNGPKETRTEFFVRVANGTKALNVVQWEKYIAGR
ncbi:hypothetical protein BH24ACT1_BH24ACT1_11760 [soil metagenome]